jgi:hypothetical protein
MIATQASQWLKLDTEDHPKAGVTKEAVELALKFMDSKQAATKRSTSPGMAQN